MAGLLAAWLGPSRRGTRGAVRGTITRLPLTPGNAASAPWGAADTSVRVHRRLRHVPTRVENGTGKSRPDRLRLPFKPTVNRFRKKMGKWENKTGKRAGTGTGTVGVFSRPFSRFPFSAGKIPAGIPVFVVVGCVTCVGNVNCCLHVFQREL